MERKISQAPELPEEVKIRWEKENHYPCGKLSKCKDCTPRGVSSCPVWAAWFKSTWASMRSHAGIK